MPQDNQAASSGSKTESDAIAKARGHRLINATLMAACVALTAIVGPALDADPIETPSEAAQAARLAAADDGIERLHAACRKRWGPEAEARWSTGGRPVCTTGRAHTVAIAGE